MLAYAAGRRRDLADPRPHPNMMLLIIGAHVAALAALMSAKMELPVHPRPVITRIDLIPIPKDPPPSPAPQPLAPTGSWITHRQPQVLTQPINLSTIDLGPTIGPGPLPGGATVVAPSNPSTTITPVKTGPRLLTPPSELKPPYPATKLVKEEEGAVTVRLMIDEEGRVVAVDPVGRADPAFLDAARRHLMTHWRFKPAREDGHAIRSTTVITLHFELDG